jgi:hypothetical protein
MGPAGSEVPYNLLNLHAMPSDGVFWNRQRVCDKAGATGYTCMLFYKPISRPFRITK